MAATPEPEPTPAHTDEVEMPAETAQPPISKTSRPSEKTTPRPKSPLGGEAFPDGWVAETGDGDDNDDEA